MKTLSVIGLALAAVLGIPACGEDAKISSNDAARFVEDQLSARTEVALTIPGVYRTLDEALPNVTYIRPDFGPAPVSDLVAVGTVTDVEKGRAFVVDGEDSPGGTVARFDASGARWWVIHATVAVERTIGSSESPRQVTVSLPLDSPKNFQKMSVGLKALGRAVFFLDKDSPLTQYDPSVYKVVGNHSLIAPVDGEGKLSLPFVEADRATRLLAGVERLDQLESKGLLPRTVPLKPAPGQTYARVDPL